MSAADEMRTVAIDFETANAGRASACAVGLAFVEAGVVTRQEYRLIRPRDMRFDAINISIHGIGPEDVADAPGYKEVMAEFLPEMAGALVLAHNASFDLGVMAASAETFGIAMPDFHSACTVRLARLAFPHLPNHKLSTVAGHLGIRLRHHHAGDDALACAEIAIHASGTGDVPAFAKASGSLRVHAAVKPRPVPKAGAISARALTAAGLPNERAGALRFVMRGSTGTPYTVDLKKGAGASFRLACSCMAARFGTECRHVKELLAGEVKNLVSDNAGAVAGLKRMVRR